jgi:hypothetical protein
MTGGVTAFWGGTVAHAENTTAARHTAQGPRLNDNIQDRCRAAWSLSIERCALCIEEIVRMIASLTTLHVLPVHRH